MKRLSLWARPPRLLAALYALALVFWLGRGGLLTLQAAQAAGRGAYPTGLWQPSAFRAESFVSYRDLEWDAPPYEDEAFYLSTDSDPKLFWEGEAFLDRVALRAVHWKPPGAVALYYRLPGQQDYSESRKVIARLEGENGYVFDLGGVTVAGFRIDPDSRGGIPTLFYGVAFNEGVSAVSRFVPTAGQLFLLLTLPALAAAFLSLLAGTAGALVRQGGN